MHSKFAASILVPVIDAKIAKIIIIFLSYYLFFIWCSFRVIAFLIAVITNHSGSVFFGSSHTYCIDIGSESIRMCFFLPNFDNGGAFCLFSYYY